MFGLHSVKYFLTIFMRNEKLAHPCTPYSTILTLPIHTQNTDTHVSIIQFHLDKHKNKSEIFI